MPNTIITNLSPQDESLLRHYLGSDHEGPITDQDLATIERMPLKPDLLKLTLERARQEYFRIVSQGQRVGAAPIGTPVQASLEVVATAPKLLTLE
ncbi:hypothetical protein KJ708_12080, partial [bacterium]|nr:hypothetical protein [bacterium]MBU1917255.1 hypothetical protein [bacterium]